VQAQQAVEPVEVQRSVSSSQMYLFLFLGAVAVGTFAGGPIGDKIGRKKVIWFSILGAAPFNGQVQGGSGCQGNGECQNRRRVERHFLPGLPGVRLEPGL
jgi:MFS family permease